MPRRERKYRPWMDSLEARWLLTITSQSATASASAFASLSSTAGNYFKTVKAPPAPLGPISLVGSATSTDPSTQTTAEADISLISTAGTSDNSGTVTLTGDFTTKGPGRPYNQPWAQYGASDSLTITDTSTNPAILTVNYSTGANAYILSDILPLNPPLSGKVSVTLNPNSSAHFSMSMGNSTPFGTSSNLTDKSSTSLSWTLVPVPPHVTILSFTKDSASSPLYSDGDYDLTYQVSGASLPSSVMPTLAVYWATGTTAASIIPNIPAVATGQLQQAINTYLFPVHISQLINPPAQATNLIAVLDDNHVLPGSEESNTIVPLSIASAPAGYTTLNAPVSGELTGLHNEPTRYQQVWDWLNNNGTIIVKYANLLHVSRIAIAGAIAWEALQNPKPNVGILYGPGKPHGDSADVAAVENNKQRYGYYIAPQLSSTFRTAYLAIGLNSIEYIAAVMNAFSTEVEVANATTNAGFQGIRNNPGVLAALYNGTTFHLTTAQAYLAAKKASGTLTFSTQGTTMGQWVANNVAYLEQAVGNPPANGY